MSPEGRESFEIDIIQISKYVVAVTFLNRCTTVKSKNVIQTIFSASDETENSSAYWFGVRQGIWETFSVPSETPYIESLSF